MFTGRAIRIAVLLLLIFIIGGITGALVGPRLVSARDGEDAEPAGRMRRGSPQAQARVLQELSTELNLSEPQRERVKALLAQFGVEQQKNNRERAQEHLQIFERMSTAIRTNLLPGQLSAYDEKLSRAKAKQERILRRMDAQP